VTLLRADTITTIRDEMGASKTAFTHLNTRVGVLVTDVNTMKLDVSVAKSKIAAIKSTVGSINSKLVNTNAGQAAIKLEFIALQSNLAETQLEVSNIMKDDTEGERQTYL